MSTLRLLSATALGLALAACAPEAAPEPTEAPVTEPAALGDAAVAPEADGEEEDTLDALVIAARDACAAGDEGFGAQIPDGSGFVSRGPDARVHVAWRLDGDAAEHIISTPQLAMEERTAFDFAAADFMRHNMVAGFDRTGITGAFRFRDGRFCVVQTERETVEALRAATLTALDTL